MSIEPLNNLLANFTTEMSGVGVALLTFLYVDFLDTSVSVIQWALCCIRVPLVSCMHVPFLSQGTLLALATTLGYVDEEGNFPKSRMAFASDAMATMFGSIFGLSPVTSFIESGSGVEAGARTGLTAVICGFYFFLSIFFAPIISSIPPWATGGALVIVGALMSSSLGDVKWCK